MSRDHRREKNQRHELTWCVVMVFTHTVTTLMFTYNRKNIISINRRARTIKLKLRNICGVRYGLIYSPGSFMFIAPRYY